MFANYDLKGIVVFLFVLHELCQAELVQPYLFFTPTVVIWLGSASVAQCVASSFPARVIVGRHIGSGAARQLQREP